MQDELHAVHRFWFGQGATDAEVAAEKGRQWFVKDPAFDAEIRARFGPLLVRVRDAFEATRTRWADDPRAMVSLVVLLDQFPRNSFRDSDQAFAFDPLARELSRTAMERGHEQVLRPIECVFLYLPLEHSEDLEDQHTCVQRMEALVTRAAPEAHKLFEDFADYARRHRAIIERFGRFPHRNALLGRTSSEEEAAFLEQPGSSF